MKSKKVLFSLIFTLVLIVVGQFTAERAAAQFDVGSIIGSIFGGGGGQTVRIVDDVSPNTIINTIKTGLIELANSFMSGQIESINIKETVLDPIAWQMAKQMQQQLTGEWLKWLGGQQPGQNGQKPFITNYSDYYGQVRDSVAGDTIFGSELSGLCSQEQEFQVRKAVYDSYVRSRSTEKAFSCTENNDATANQQMNTLERMFRNTVNCDGTTACAVYKGERILAEKEANAIANENKLTNLTDGLLPQRVCRVINDPDGRPRQLCELVNPPHLAAEAVTEQIVTAPSRQLAQMDEFNEIVSQFMSYLPNQLIQGFGGIMGLIGDPEFANSVFGPNGDLSYLDALIGDTTAPQASSGGNPIKTALAAEIEYASLQQLIVNEVTETEGYLSTAKAGGQCTSLELTGELANAKRDSTNNLAVSESTRATLTSLDQQYDATNDGSVKNAIMSAFMNAKHKGAFRDAYQNRQLESSYINYTFSLANEQFRCEIVQCGGGPSSICVLGTS